MIKCCIFDLDGTILDTIDAITYFVNKTLQNHDIETITVDECKYFIGDGAKLLIERALASKGITDSALNEAVLKEYNSAYDKDPFYITHPYKGIPELLSSLKEEGIKLAVLSNKPHETTVSLVSHFFGGIFDAVYGGRKNVPLKPDCTAATDIISGFGVKNTETVWIGDTATDIHTGKNLGVSRNIGVLWGFRKYDELYGAGATDIVDNAEMIFEIIREAQNESKT